MTIRVGIAGAGISGLTLAGILSRRLPHVHVTVLERAPAARDQGYGLDLDANGQEALARAGVYHRYWDCSQPYSDHMAFFRIGSHGPEPAGVMFRPALLRWLFPATFAARPETNRGALRDILLDEMATRANTGVVFDTAVRDARLHVDGGCELFGDSGKSHGVFDLIIDAMGLHSTLRHHRVVDASGGKAFGGTVHIHGVINSPEAACGAPLLARLRKYGSVAGYGRGYLIFLQRFGAGSNDGRTCCFYQLNHLDSAESLLDEIGVSPPSSRASGIMTDERLDKVKRWVLHDMGEVFDESWRDAIRSLDRVTADDVALPLVCIGDSLLNCGLGGGGILAMQDANELAALLEKEGAFDDAGRPDLSSLRAAEGAMLARKQEFHAEKQQRARGTCAQVAERGRGPTEWPFELDDLGLPGWKLGLARLLLPRVAALTNAWYRWDEWRLGRVGATPSTPIYPSVKKLLDSGEGK
ncbi:hypothetical protein EMIHUDRAFT_451154 [Emiliania huxleyi CCMP1516]|uniref:FAD-binding domain-containing protein n=2 Tax=Emiliania huxleyi TaxID=2903 RepID=A0A0D3J7S3_EMIH1|nr:hypothetical protein EMIHUDRAFT_451154 [Emiliania huxleyi CCMP1516]EOD19558.1 hypothetical protein EMIHUDRAFT_451154 [Emiliania huxleyi CCMP1516]|eukprot:XP_005771987.1 hypothetical protein EMIHUDRAFT_451154 [Emiliania huxleyi CCMP1516]